MNLSLLMTGKNPRIECLENTDKDMNIEKESSSNCANKKNSAKKTSAGMRTPCFEVSDLVLGHSHKYNQLFDAKILKIRPHVSKQGEKQWQYLLHFQGWASRWDDWYDEKDIYPCNEETRERQANLKREAKEMAAADRAAKKHRAGEPASKPGGRGPDQNIDHSTAELHSAFRISIPKALERQLADDLGFVEDYKLVPLPRSPSVADVLGQFAAQELCDGHAGAAEWVQGIADCFRMALRPSLLYAFEEAQYAGVKAARSDARACEVYGAEHLLRLFVRLPGLASRAFHACPAREEAAQLQEFQGRVRRLLRFLDGRRAELFLTAYQPVDAAYLASFLGSAPA